MHVNTTPEYVFFIERIISDETVTSSLMFLDDNGMSLSLLLHVNDTTGDDVSEEHISFNTSFSSNNVVEAG